MSEALALELSHVLFSYGPAPVGSASAGAATTDAVGPAAAAPAPAGPAAAGPAPAGTAPAGPAPVLRDLSLAVPEGGVTGIVGPNGCGKSTLLKLADGLLVPASGEVRVFGRGVAALSSRERARLVALLPQVHRTPSMTVRDLVMCGRYAHMGVFGRPGEADCRAVAEALAETGIEALADKPARGLSGGERQRAFLAMAVAQDARLLMLDEPTTYLDVRAALETMELARKLSERRDTTVLAVIHDLDLAFRTCDRLVVLDGGAVRAQGAATDAAVTEAVSDAFGVDVCRMETPHGVAWSFFSRE